MLATPDVVISHDVASCGCCNNSLKGTPSYYDARQVFDIPPITMQVTEHRRLHKTCGVCGTHNKGVYPEGIAQSKGFLPEITVEDFPLRGKSVLLHIKRRRWTLVDTGKIIKRDWNLIATGTRITTEFVSFLKGIS